MSHGGRPASTRGTALPRARSQSWFGRAGRGRDGQLAQRPRPAAASARATPPVDLAGRRDHGPRPVPSCGSGRAVPGGAGSSLESRTPGAPCRVCATRTTPTTDRAREGPAGPTSSIAAAAQVGPSRSSAARTRRGCGGRDGSGRRRAPCAGGALRPAGRSRDVGEASSRAREPAWPGTSGQTISTARPTTSLIGTEPLPVPSGRVKRESARCRGGHPSPRSCPRAR